MSLFVSLICSLFVLAATQHCQRAQVFVVDTQSKCLLSAADNLENCCFVCPILNASGYFQLCGSVYELGFATCTQAGSLAARQSACLAQGGDINAGAFTCLLSAGTNKSQSTGWVPPTTGTSTVAPTSHGVLVTAPALLFASLLLAYALTTH